MYISRKSTYYIVVVAAVLVATATRAAAAANTMDSNTFLCRRVLSQRATGNAKGADTPNKQIEDIISGEVLTYGEPMYCGKYCCKAIMAPLVLSSGSIVVVGRAHSLENAGV